MKKILTTSLPAAYLAAGIDILAIVLILLFGSTSDRREMKDLDSAAWALPY